MSHLLPRLFGTLNLIAAVVVAVGVFMGLPARWWAVDVPAVGLILMLGAAGVGLATGRPWGERVARIASMITLGLGLLLVATLALTASYLSGIYGPVGMGGGVILALVAALALPYLVALPASQLLWLGPRARPRAAKTEGATT